MASRLNLYHQAKSNRLLSTPEHAMFLKNIIFLLCFCTFGQAAAQLSCPYQAYVFLSPTCPICIGYAPELNRLSKEFKDHGLELIGVFPNYYVTDAEIDAFRQAYQLEFATIRDSGLVLTTQFQASTTPEIFLTDTNGKVFYQGQIDNAYFRPGKRRGRMTEEYFREAVKAVLEGKIPKISQTQPIGCVIVRS
jgi:thiol-disulfide isomerase/thioredoxin